MKEYREVYCEGFKPSTNVLAERLRPDYAERYGPKVYVQTEDTFYYANDLTTAMQLWANDGMHEVVDVGAV